MNNMSSKNLTHIFTIMRDKAIQRRNVYNRDETYSDRAALMEAESIEMGINEHMSKQPPEWTFHVEEVKYNIDSLKEKIKKLSALQTNLLRRPSLDDNTEEEKQLGALSVEIKSSLERCQSLMLQIKQKRCTGREVLLNRNVVRSLANSLQDIKNEFTTACHSYTSTVNNIKKSSSFLVDTNDYDSDYGTFEEGGGSNKHSSTWTEEQMLFLEDNSLLVEERDKAFQNILRSTLDLNQLFKDVSHLVLEQGSVIDQIDYNIEQTGMKVSEGTKQLRKAEQHQRKNRKMVCVMGLAGAIVFFILLLVLTKS